MANETINKPKTVVYVPLDFTGGLTDLVLTIRKPDGSIFNTITMDEQSGGSYTASYTPDTLGNWQEKVSSVVNGDLVIRAYDVVAYDAVDIKSQTDTIETKIDTVDGKVDVVDTNVDSVKSTVETTDGKVDTVDSNVDAVKAKTDNLPANTASDLSNIQSTVNGISSNVNPGGYFAG